MLYYRIPAELDGRAVVSADADKYEYFKKTVNALKEHNANPNSETLTVYVDYLRGLPLA